MSDVARRMCEYKISSIFLTDEADASFGDSPSTNESRIVGIVTQTDLTEQICAKDMRASTIAAESVMSTPVSISEDARVEDATRMMIEMRIRHLAIKDKKGRGKILGVITGSDLGRYLRQKLMQNEQAFQDLGEELSIADVFSILEPLSSDKRNQYEQC
jgi:CBS domain-containing protein